MRHVFLAALFSVEAQTEQDATKLVNEYVKNLPSGTFVINTIHSDGVTAPPIDVFDDIGRGVTLAFRRSLEANGWPPPMEPKSKKAA